MYYYALLLSFINKRVSCAE